MEPYYIVYDKYRNLFICNKCGDVDDEFASDRNNFTFVKTIENSETWCCKDCKAELSVDKRPEIDDFYIPDIEIFGEDDIFNKDYMKTIGFKVIKDDGEYGLAVDLRTNGMTVLSWNRNGPSGTYFGEKFEEKSSYLGIGKDGDTRKAFSGYIFSREDMEKVLSLTW